MDILGTAGGLFTNYANMKFAEEMAGSQYQRSVADMKNAGLNPNAIFGSGGGSQAASPGGQMDNPVQGGGLMSSAKGAVDLNQQVQSTEKIKASTETEKAQADVQRANAKIANSNADVIEKENTAYKKALEAPGGEYVATQKKYGGNDAVSGAVRTMGGALSSIGNAFGGTATAKQIGAAMQNPLGRHEGAGPKFNEALLESEKKKGR